MLSRIYTHLSKNDEEYEVEGIRDSTVFAKESKAGHQPETCLPGAAEHLGACIRSSTPPEADQRLYPAQPTTISPLIDAAPPMA